jgi:hypothetical protein
MNRLTVLSLSCLVFSIQNISSTPPSSPTPENTDQQIISRTISGRVAINVEELARKAQEIHEKAEKVRRQSQESIEATLQTQTSALEGLKQLGLSTSSSSDVQKRIAALQKKLADDKKKRELIS